jgi:hypothetical protein
VSGFATRFGINAVVLEQPVGADVPTRIPERRDVAITVPVQIDEKLAFLHHVLRDEVLD